MGRKPKPIRDAALRGGLVTGIAQGAKIGIQLLSIVTLSRLLLPGDFGLIAAVWPAVAFLGLLQNMGLQQAVIQREETTQSQLNQIFWVSALVGAGCAVVMSLAAPAVAADIRPPRWKGRPQTATKPSSLVVSSTPPIRAAQTIVR